MQKNRLGSLVSVVVLLLVLITAGYFGLKIFGNTMLLPKEAASNENSADNSTAPSENLPTNAPTGEITLIIDSPEADSTVSTSKITVAGITVAGADVSVNNVDTKADNNGNFSVKIDLEEGENTILVVANDADGKYAESEIIVNLNTE